MRPNVPFFDFLRAFWLKRKATSCSESVAVCPDCSRYPEGGSS